jgi:hypothetical protein
MIPRALWCAGCKFLGGVGLAREALGASSAFHPFWHHQTPDLCEQFPLPRSRSTPLEDMVLPPGPWLSRGLQKAAGVEKLAGPKLWTLTHYAT